MKTTLASLILLLSAAITTAQQNHFENIRQALQKGDSMAIASAVIAAQHNPQELKSNDTITEISRIIQSVACKYGQNDLSKNSYYKDEISGNKLIILQPEVTTSFCGDLDFRGVLEGKYQKKRMDMDRDFKEKYSQIPSENTDKKYPYYKTYYTLKLNKDYPFDQNRIISLDTTLVRQINSYLKKKGKRLNSEKIQKVLNAYKKTYTNKTKIYFGYNISIYKIIFNDKLDECIVQFSVPGCYYEAFLFKLENNWPVAYVREILHYDFI